VALSLAPMLASRMLKDGHEGHGPRGGIIGAIGRGFAALYAVALRFCLNNPLIVVIAAVLFAASSWFVFIGLPQELTPVEDRSQISLRVSAPQTVSLDFTRSQMQRIEELVQPYVDSGEIESVFSISGFGSNTNSGFLTLTLAPWEERQRTQAQIAAEISQLVANVPGVRTFAMQGNSLGIRGGGNGLQFAVVGSNYQQLATAAEAIAEEMRQDARFERVNVNYDTTQPQLTLSIDRERAANLGIDINGLGTTMQAMIDGADMGSVFIEDASYSVRMVSSTSPINDPRDLESIFLKTGDGRYVPMSTIATLTEAPIAPSLSREQQRRAVSVSANLAEGFGLGDAYNQAYGIAQPLLPEGAAMVPLAEAATLGEANNGLIVTFSFALIIIFLVLAAQFESVWSAVIVMITVPFGLACAVYALLLTGGSMNVYSQIGLVLVVGIMAKNGILIVEFANQLRDQGYSVREAIEDAANIRRRPVVMTMLATILGGLPLIVFGGAGAEARQAVGWIMVGGLGLATVSTLLLTPVAYLLIAGFAKPKAEEEARLERELSAAEGQGVLPGPAE